MRAHDESSDLLTAEDLLSVDVAGKSTELIRGHLVVREPPGTRHGGIAARLTYLLGRFVYGNELGSVFAQDTGFKLESRPDTVRAPDVAFLSRERAAAIPPRGYAELAPDLAAEILSPDDRPGEVLAKIGTFLDAGTKLVWVIDPERAQARVYRADGTERMIDADGSLDGEDVLSGFTVTLREILE